MRELDLQEGGGGDAMHVYAGYGLGKHLKRAMRIAGRKGKKLLKGVGEDVAVSALDSALSGQAPTKESLLNSAKQSAKKRGKNEAKNMVRPYL